MPNTNYWYNEMFYKIVIHENLRQKCLIFRVMCFTMYGPKRRLVFAKFLSQNTSNNLAIVCQCECASMDNLWQPVGTARAWQYRHIKLGYALRRYYVTNLTRIWRQLSQF